MFDLLYVMQQGLNEQTEEQCKPKSNKAKNLEVKRMNVKNGKE
jgi:hypothetical protein